MPNTSVKPRQSGMSMIGLMVGLLLAMIAILAGMTLYQSIVRSSIQTRTDATQDGQLASALLSLQLELQSAGFGLTAGANPHIQLVGGPGDNPQTFYWRQQIGGVNICKGFRIQTDAGGTSRQLQILQPTIPASCNAVVALNSIAWSIANVVAEFRASTAADAKLPTIGMGLTNPSCAPYGLGQAAVHPQLTITADNAARRAALTPESGAVTAAPNDPFVYNFCLANL